jgi:salicylate hydroxylase
MWACRLKFDAKLISMLQHTDLVQILYNAAMASGAEIETNADVRVVSPPSPTSASRRPAVMLKDGRTFEADVVIGADGPYSTVRQAVETTPTIPKWTGKVSFSGLIPMERLMQDPVLNDPDISHGMPVWCGPSHACKGMCLYATVEPSKFASYL